MCVEIISTVGQRQVSLTIPLAIAAEASAQLCFICERYGFQIDENARARARDIALIERGLEESASKPWARYLTDYRTWLAGKPTRTQAQYLRTAQAFCEAADLGGPFA